MYVTPVRRRAYIIEYCPVCAFRRQCWRHNPNSGGTNVANIMAFSMAASAGANVC